MSSIQREHFAEIVRVATELLGAENPTTQALQEILRSSYPDAINRGLILIRALPKAQRDHILSHAGLNLNTEAKTLSWLMEQVGDSTAIPPGETKH
jgi:hypothetical protein